MFLFKQKTAYEMRISDWSSDVCSSDLTWVRTSETRFATWDEFEDLDGPEPLWRLSPERMKMTREHLVPLSRQVVELLRRRRRETNGDFVFPGAKHGKPIRSEEHTSGLQSLMRISYAVFCLKKKTKKNKTIQKIH